MKKKLNLSHSKKKSKIEGFPKLSDCLIEAKEFNKKLMPIVKLDGGVVDEKWEGLPFTFMLQNVDVDRIDFKLEEGKYRLLAPLKLRKLEEYGKSDIKREYLQTTVDKVEELDYQKVDHYSNDGLLQYSGSLSYSPNRRLVYHYETINGVPMPVTKTIQYFLGNGEWLDLEVYTYDYDSDGFLDKTTTQQPARDIRMVEKMIYKKTRKGYTASKELAPHHLPVVDPELGDPYTVIPFSAVFKESETDWNVTIGGRYIFGEEKENRLAVQGELIHLHAFNNFYNLNSSFLKNTCKIENQSEIPVKVNWKDELPDTIEYTFSCPEKNDQWSLNYMEKSATKVIIEQWGDKHTIEHLGREIQITNENRFGTSHFTLSGHYTLQQVIMMIRTQSYLWCSDFEQQRISDWIMTPGYTNPMLFNFTYTKTKTGMDRVVHVVRIKENKTEGKLRLGKPDWVQSNETPRDPDEKKMEFVAQLDHSNMFGTLYLFYSEKHQMISQVFQCS